YWDYAHYRLVRAVCRDPRPHWHGTRDEGDHAYLSGVPDGPPGVRRAGATAHAHGQAGAPAAPAGTGRRAATCAQAPPHTTLPLDALAAPRGFTKRHGCLALQLSRPWAQARAMS